ncbi:hypothetical protein [Exiguobacterium sp. UBA5002]|uniref:hypothetical protein n=1 Tax=Exiguobacterium sp. UBA5002 TaxID=1946497 RepID=UPI0025C364D9|nr:hypothetical protein [Exiguobacterium sp. UBA5002]
MKRMTTTVLAAMIAGATVCAGSASAATKEETKYTTQYTNLKTGMTMTEVAKVLYGNDYKKQLVKKSGSTVLKKQAESTEISYGQKTKFYYFTNGKNGDSDTSLVFMTKKNSSVYRLTGKSFDIYRENTKSAARESTRKLAKGAKVKKEMTAKQLDAILSGTGLGEWTGVEATDWSSIQSKAELAAIGAEKSSYKTYVFPTSTGGRKMVLMSYDYKKKTFKVADHTSL